MGHVGDSVLPREHAVALGPQTGQHRGNARVSCERGGDRLHGQPPFSDAVREVVPAEGIRHEDADVLDVEVLNIGDSFHAHRLSSPSNIRKHLEIRLLRVHGSILRALLTTNTRSDSNDRQTLDEIPTINK